MNGGGGNHGYSNANNTSGMRSRRYSGDYHDEDNNSPNKGAGHTTPFYLANQAPTSLRGDGYGGGGILKYSPLAPNKDNGLQSHNYEPDESEVWRAYVAQVHFSNRGHWYVVSCAFLRLC